MIEGMISQKIGEFLEKEAHERGLAFNDVEAGMKLQEIKDKEGSVKGYRPYYFLRVQGKFARYVELSELL